MQNILYCNNNVLSIVINPLVPNVTKNAEKKYPGTNGLTYKIQQYLNQLFQWVFTIVFHKDRTNNKNFF